MENISDSELSDLHQERGLLITQELENLHANETIDLLQSQAEYFEEISIQPHSSQHNSLFDRLCPETREFLTSKSKHSFASNGYMEGAEPTHFVEMRSDVNRLIDQQASVSSSSQQFVSALAELKRSAEGSRPLLSKAGGNAFTLDPYVHQWLVDLNLLNVERYANIFAHHEIDEESLLLLSEFNLKQMGISAIGTLNKMISSIRGLKTRIGSHRVSRIHSNDNRKSAAVVNKPMRFNSKPLTAATRSRSLSSGRSVRPFRAHLPSREECERSPSDRSPRRVQKRSQNSRPAGVPLPENAGSANKLYSRSIPSASQSHNANQNIAKLAAQGNASIFKRKKSKSHPKISNAFTSSGWIKVEQLPSSTDIEITVERRKAKQRIEQAKQAMEKKLGQILHDKRLRLAVEYQRRHNDTNGPNGHSKRPSRPKKSKNKRPFKKRSSVLSENGQILYGRVTQQDSFLKVEDEAVKQKHPGKDDVLTQFHIDSQHPAVIFEDQLNELELRIQNLLDQKQLKQGEPRTLIKSIDQLQKQLLGIQEQVSKQRARISAVKKSPTTLSHPPKTQTSCGLVCVPPLERRGQLPKHSSSTVFRYSREEEGDAIAKKSSHLATRKAQEFNPPAMWTGGGSNTEIDRPAVGEGVLSGDVGLAEDSVRQSAFRQVASNSGLIGLPPLHTFGNSMDSDIQYNEKDWIGEGSFTEVFRGSYHGSDVAVKRVKLSVSLIDQRSFSEEVTALSELSHPNIVGIITSSCRYKVPLILCQLVGGLCLQELLKGNDSLDHSAFYQILEDITAGIAYLHGHHPKPLCHGRLTSRNVLLSNQLRAKISDVGLAQFRETAQKLIIEGHSDADLPGGISLSQLAWSCPELLLFPTPTSLPANDLYTLGVLVWEMLSRRRPYDLLTAGQTRDRILSGPPLTLAPSCPAGLRQLVTRLWQLEPTNRPSAKEVQLLLAQFKFPSPWQALLHSSGTPLSALQHIPTSRVLIAAVLNLPTPSFTPPTSTGAQHHIPSSGPCGILANHLPDIPGLEEPVTDLIARVRAALNLPLVTPRSPQRQLQPNYGQSPLQLIQETPTLDRRRSDSIHLEDVHGSRSSSLDTQERIPPVGRDC